jgi:polysaccharide pyruvyl transferase WcaK-like protein
MCADLVRTLAEQTRRQVVLVPHVTGASFQDDDHTFLEIVARGARQERGASIDVLGRGFSAAETKWVIAQCAAFAGARTHSTIASLSSGVPTVTFAYSTKGVGINQDVFGCDEYCLRARDFSVASAVNMIQKSLEDGKGIRARLDKRMPDVRERAFCAGKILREVATS